MGCVRVSVVMTSYNGEKYIAGQISSILSALGPNDELIISDDGSTDASPDIIDSFRKEDKRVLSFAGPRKGLNSNINFLLSKARGDYIFIADQDDVWRNDKVDIVLDAFKKHPDIQVIHHNANVIDGDGVSFGYTVYDKMSFSKSLFKFIIKSHIFGSMMAMRRSFIKFDFVPSKNCYDSGIACYAMKMKTLLFIDDILMDYRRHGTNVSSFSRRPLRIIIPERIRLIAFIVSRVVFRKKLINRK